MRLLPGWMAGCEGGLWRMNGDASIRKRPVDRIADPLRLMGAEIEVTDGRFPPIRIDGKRLKGIEYELPVASRPRSSHACCWPGSGPRVRPR